MRNRPELIIKVPEPVTDPSAYGLSERQIMALRETYYPAHSAYGDLSKLLPELRPFYRIETRSTEVALHAAVVKPPLVRAEIVLKEPNHFL